MSCAVCDRGPPTLVWHWCGRYPTVSRVPGVVPNQTNACLLAFVDSGYNVLELSDGPSNLMGSRVPMTDIARHAV